MKAGRISASILFSILGVLLLGSISSAYASTFLGEFCFQEQSEKAIYRLAATDMGGGHVLVNGRLIDVNGTFAPVHGSAEVGQGVILLTVNGGDLFSSNGTSITGTEAFTTNFILSLSSLSGSCEEIVTQANNGVISTFVTTDTINFVVCP